MSLQTSPATQFSWSEILPWTIIFRSLSVACSVTVLVMAMIGVVATPMGWIVSESVFIGSDEILNSNPILAEIAEINRSPYRGVFLASQDSQSSLAVMGVNLSGPKLVFQQTVKPFYAIFGGATTTREFLYYACGSFWSLLVWSFVGLGITRVALLRFTRNERAGLDDAFEYAIDYFTTCFSALAMPIGLAFLLCIPTFLIGLLLGFDFGALLVGIVWIVVLGFALALGILLLGLMVSWPLVVSSVAAEGQNAFDAITRSFAYAFQRPVNYFCYALVAVIFGGVCWLVVLQFTESVIRLSFWSTSWGANRISVDRIETIKGTVSPYPNKFESTTNLISQFQDSTPNRDVSEPASSQQNLQTTAAAPTKIVVQQDALGSGGQLVESRNLKTARGFIQFWTGFAKTVAAAFIHGLFWCMASAIYLLLRKDVDETEMDEIFMIDERRTYDLPPLESDEHGIPQVQPLPIDETDPSSST